MVDAPPQIANEKFRFSMYFTDHLRILIIAPLQVVNTHHARGGTLKISLL
jgi:hypothetical protein